jgi:hypothetical protein
MIDEQVIVDEAVVEELVRKVRGVLAVRAVRNIHGQIDEIHAVGSPERSAKQMVRDIESILFVRGGVRLDHRKISLVQIAETSMPPALLRVQLIGVEARPSALPPEVVVTLGVGARRFEGRGQARGAQDGSGEWLTAYAAAQALDGVIGAHGQLHVENIQRQAFGGLQVYLAHLTLSIDDSIETLLGISVVRDDAQIAVARAVLDAVNRRLQRLLGEGKSALSA